jgi:hypothetical protein
MARRIRRETFAVEIRRLLEEGRQNKPHVIHPWKEGYNTALKDLAEAIAGNIFEDDRFISWAGFQEENK